MGNISQKERDRRAAEAKNKASTPPAKPASVEGSGNVPANPAVVAASANIEKAKRGRISGEEKRQLEQQAQQAAQVQQILQTLYSPEYWEPLVVAPANTMLALTGDPVWNIPEKEARVLSGSTAMCAQYFGMTDPKWLAVIMGLFHMSNTYGLRTIQYFANKKKEREEKEKLEKK